MKFCIKCLHIKSQLVLGFDFIEVQSIYFYFDDCIFTLTLSNFFQHTFTKFSRNLLSCTFHISNYYKIIDITIIYPFTIIQIVL